MKIMILFVAIIILGVSLCLLMSCCRTLFPDEKLSLQRTNYTGNELRTDGYYYTQKITKEYSHTTIKFLYRNGITVSCGSFITTDLNIVEEQLPKRYNFLKDKLSFGVFCVLNNEILMEKWNTAGGGVRLPIVKSKGYIESSTTFRIIESYASDTKETYYDNEIWHFRQFSPKPDSTNEYIK